MTTARIRDPDDALAILQRLEPALSSLSNDIRKQEQKLDALADKQEQKLDAFAGKQEQKFNSLAESINKQSEAITDLRVQIAGLEGRIGGIEGRLTLLANQIPTIWQISSVLAVIIGGGVGIAVFLDKFLR